MGTRIASSNNDLMAETFRLYAVARKRDDELLFIDEARKYATELYAVTADLAPTKAEITADVQKLGWKIPTRFADGRLARGVASNWLGLAWDNYYARVKKRGRRSKKSHKDEATVMAQKPTLQQMQAFVVKMRMAARKFLATGWLPAVERFGGSRNAAAGRVGVKHGSATLTRTEGRLTYTFTNSTPGIADMDQKHGIIAKASANWMADKQKYLLKKIGEGLVKLRRAA